MIKKILTPLVFALSVGSFSVYAQFGGAPGGGDGNGGNGGGFNPEDPVSLSGLLAKCAVRPSTQDKRECLGDGFTYEVNENVVYTSANEKMSFTSELISFHGVIIQEYHDSIMIECSNCDGATANQDIVALNDRVLDGWVDAVINNGFQTRSLSSNGFASSSASRAVNNDGGLVTGVLKDVLKGTATQFINDKVKELLSNKNSNATVGFAIATQNGKPFAIVRILADGDLPILVLLGDFITENSGSGRSEGEFPISIDLREAEAFRRIVEINLENAFNSFNQERQGNPIECRLVYTGESNNLVGSVRCF